MFSQREKSYLASSRLAREEMKIYDQLLGIRIQLQKSLDTANQLPVGDINPVDNSGEVDDVKEVLTKKLEGIIADLVTMDKGSNKEDGSGNGVGHLVGALTNVGVDGKLAKSKAAGQPGMKTSAGRLRAAPGWSGLGWTVRLGGWTAWIRPQP